MDTISQDITLPYTLWESDLVCTPVCSTNKTDHHDIDELLLKVALNTTTLAPTHLAVLLLSGIRRDLHYYVIKRIDHQRDSNSQL
jgi:excinuclease UvrABC nuclease subunit